MFNLLDTTVPLYFSLLQCEMLESIEVKGSIGTKWVNSLQFSVSFYVETSHLICNANEIISFHMERNTGLN